MKVLVLSFSGIGNSLMAVPFLNELIRRTGSKPDILCLNSGIAQSFKLTTDCNNIYILPQGVMAALFFVLGLRANNYDYCVTLFPSNKWQFNLIAFLTGAKTRIVHEYSVGNVLSSLQNKHIRADSSLHDVEQNCLLLKGFNLDFLCSRHDAVLKIGPQAHDSAQLFLQDNILPHKFIGIHPGGGGEFSARWQGEQKRWPCENFAALIDKLIEQRKVKVVLFGGKREDYVKKAVKALSTHPQDIIFAPHSDLEGTAALIARSQFFISNDSGLMHLAVIANIPVVGIFGPTNFKRTAPWRSRNYVVHAGVECSPCLAYPMNATNSKISCKHNFICFDRVGVDDVLKVIEENGL